MSKHSEDSWVNDGSVIYLPQGKGGFCLKGLPEPEVTAEKIARAVNACKGVSTDMLHEGDYKAMINLNDALMSFVKVFECHSFNGDVMGVPVISLPYAEYEQLMGKIKEAKSCLNR